MYKLFILLFILIGMNSCTENEYKPQDCDLIFQIAETTNFSKAITDATAPNDDIKFDHVGLIFTENGYAQVLEASAQKGVSIITLQEFINSLPAGYIIKRVNCNFSASKIIENAKSHIGEPYDWSYLPNNGKMYCSELIFESFTDSNNKHIFHAHPMNFRNEKGEMPQFWTDLFNKLGEAIPEGVIGTNPNDLSKESVMIEVYRYIPSANK